MTETFHRYVRTVSRSNHPTIRTWSSFGHFLARSLSRFCCWRHLSRVDGFRPKPHATAPASPLPVRMCGGALRTPHAAFGAAEE